MSCFCYNILSLHFDLLSFTLVNFYPQLFWQLNHWVAVMQFDITECLYACGLMYRYHVLLDSIAPWSKCLFQLPLESAVFSSISVPNASRTSKWLMLVGSSTHVYPNSGVKYKICNHVGMHLVMMYCMHMSLSSVASHRCGLCVRGQKSASLYCIFMMPVRRSTAIPEATDP